MPIEVKEIIVKANIGKTSSSSTPPLRQEEDDKWAKELKEEILGECLEQIQKYLKRLHER
ncbi:hypothetical protein K4L44_00275 [Halosquirtibacter laminarini]|uniref:Uncharacterized protein n=1 Tax=Halosquirtibacter laminarini TaxID=3374600 RepID=A0AC61NNJ5_9BACT|nr:hypothetical protein K4L44_00275 [Prolixibacteraceae bacterium]